MIKKYSVKEIMYTLQGEGYHTGRPAVFCRLNFCNLWSGKEEDRAGATCPFCDTDFVGTDGTHGGRYTAEELAEKMSEIWGHPGTDWHRSRWAVLTGGEPMLQVDGGLVDALHRHGFGVQVETNGTVPIPFRTLDWITLSPKIGSTVVLDRANEVKVVYPQDGLDPRGWEIFATRHFYMQPKDGPDRESNTRLAVEYCLSHPRWRLSLQTHKILGIR